jgi:hypothetical protein
MLSFRNVLRTSSEGESAGLIYSRSDWRLKLARLFAITRGGYGWTMR